MSEAQKVDISTARYRGAKLKKMQINIILGILLFSLCLGSQAETIAKLKIHFVSYNNPGGKGSNGHCCDGKWGICQRNGCDHYFKICLDDPSSPAPNMESCKYLSKRTSQIENQNRNEFGDKIGDTPNPVVVALDEVKPEMLLRVEVWDKDIGNDDHVDSLSKTWNPVLVGTYALSGRSSLEIRTVLQCESGYYGKTCTCKVTGNVARCDHLGRATCKPGWKGPKCTQRGQACPDGWKGYEGHCYLFSTETRTWEDARRRCQGYGGDLVAIDSWPEDAFIVGELKRTLAERGNRLVWIGLNDRQREGTWVWNDNIPMRTRHWRYGEPNDSYRGGEDCGSVYQRSGDWMGKWNDINCDINRLHFICEKVARR